MPAASLVPKNGAIVLGTMLADFNAFDIESAQVVEGCTPYGVNTCSKNVGNGTPDFTINITAYALAHSTNTAPNLPGLEAAGLALTATLDTGVTEACQAIRQRERISHGRMRATVPRAMTLKNGGDVTETWVTT